MFGNEVAKDFRDLADVAHLSEHTKGKHAVNVSNTEILREQNAAKEAAKSMLATGAEIKANLAVPFAGTLIRKGLEGRKAKKLAAEEAKADEASQSTEAAALSSHKELEAEPGPAIYNNH